MVDSSQQLLQHGQGSYCSLALVDRLNCRASVGVAGLWSGEGVLSGYHTDWFLCCCRRSGFSSPFARPRSVSVVCCRCPVCLAYVAVRNNHVSFKRMNKYG